MSKTIGGRIPTGVARVERKNARDTRWNEILIKVDEETEKLSLFQYRGNSSTMVELPAKQWEKLKASIDKLFEEQQ
jgi:hypothetical protein